MKRFKLSEAGDTIIEVLVVLAILGFAMSIATATADKGLKQSRNAEEHSTAQGILNSQIELLRAAVGQQISLPQPVPFCMNGGAPKAFASGATIPADAKTDTANQYTQYPAECVQNTLYHVSVVYDSASDNYDVRVRWDGAGDLGSQQANSTYRVHTLTGSVSSGIPLTGAATRIKVIVNSHEPDSSNPLAIPSCSDSVLSNVDGASVELRHRSGASGPPQPGTTASGSVLFPANAYATYYARLTGTPSGYSNCSPTTSSDQTAQPGVDTPIQFEIVRNCHLITVDDPSTPIYNDPSWHTVTPVYRTDLSKGAARNEFAGFSSVAPNSWDGYPVFWGIYFDYVGYNPSYGYFYWAYDAVYTTVLDHYDYSDWRSDLIGWQAHSHQERVCS